MSGTKGPAPEGLVTSDAVYHGHLFRQLLLGFIGLMVLAGAGVGTYFVAQKFGLLAKEAPKQAHSETSIDPAQELADAKQALMSANTPQEKTKAYEQLGNAYMANNQPQAAIESYQSAAPADDSTKSQVLGDLVGAYLQAGDKQKAIEAIQQLIPLLQASNNSEDRALASRYQSLITEIQARP